MTKREQRSLNVFNCSIQMIKNHKKLLWIPSLSCLLNTILFGLILVPIFKHELHRLEHNGAPVTHYIWFYLLLFLFFYLRNTFNCVFDTLNYLSIQYLQSGKDDHIKQAREKIKGRIRDLLVWSHFLTFIGFIYAFKCLYSNNKHQRPATGGAYYRYSVMLAHVLFAQKSQGSPLSTLQAAGKLITATWGKPPMRMGVTLIPVFIKYLLWAAAPFIAAVLITPYNTIILYTTFGISFLLSMGNSVLSKTIHALMLHATYQYASQKKVVEPLNDESAKSIFMELKFK